MPFQSKSQMQACYAKNDPRWDCHAWAHETPDLKKLPEHKAVKRQAMLKQMKGK